MELNFAQQFLYTKTTQTIWIPVSIALKGCLVLRFQNCVLKKKKVCRYMLLQNCVLEADNHIFIQTIRLFMFYKRNNQIITSKRNPKHPLNMIKTTI
ncbi:hypothetical protein Hanom_Chr13g01192331 [Helianthus anomalus]